MEYVFDAEIGDGRDVVCCDDARLFSVYVGTRPVGSKVEGDDGIGRARLDR